MDYMKIFILFILFLTCCASTKINLDEVYYAPKDDERLIPAKDYHNEVMAKRDFSPICADMLLNGVAPSSKIIIEIKVLKEDKLKLVNSIYRPEDKDLANCIEELILKYEFPKFSIVDYKKTYLNNTYYSFSKPFKCSSKNINQTIKYEMEPYTADDFYRSLSVWDYLVINLTSFTMGCE